MFEFLILFCVCIALFDLLMHVVVYPMWYLFKFVDRKIKRHRPLCRNNEFSNIHPGHVQAADGLAQMTNNIGYGQSRGLRSYGLSSHFVQSINRDEGIITTSSIPYAREYYVDEMPEDPTECYKEDYTKFGEFIKDIERRKS